MSPEISPNFLVTQCILITLVLAPLITFYSFIVIGTVWAFVRNWPEKWELAIRVFFVCLIPVLVLLNWNPSEDAFPTPVNISVIVGTVVLHILVGAGVVKYLRWEKTGFWDEDPEPVVKAVQPAEPVARKTSFKKAAAAVVVTGVLLKIGGSLASRCLEKPCDLLEGNKNHEQQ